MSAFLNRLLPAPPGDEREKQLTIRTLRSLLLVTIVGDAAALIVTLIGGFGWQLYLPILLLLGFQVASLVLLQRGTLLPAQILLPTTLFMLVSYIVAVGYGLHDINVLAFSLVISLAGLTLGLGASFVFAFLIILVVFGIGLAEMNGLLVSPTSSLTLPVSPFAISIVILAIAFIQMALINLLNDNVRRARENEQEQIQTNAELLELKSALEVRIAERTTQLQSANAINVHRASQFEAIVQVMNAINSIRDTSELLPKIASVVSERFNYYHVGIFLNDENNLYTFLTASNSDGGQRMLARGHNLKINEQGIVGYVAGSGAQRVAHNVGEDVAYFNNPDLPDTKSEMALPLHSGHKTVGVLDVQSTKEDSFPPEDIRVLGILADQVSLAIDNTRLYETTRRSLEEAEALYRQYLRQAWSRLPREQQLAGYRYSQRGAMPLEVPVFFDADVQKDVDEGARLTVPIKLRGETIGNLIVHIPQEKSWNQDQIDLVEAVADRVALSAENARLFDETSRRAERERMVTEITSKIRSTNDPEAMIQTALNELRNALGATQVQLIPQAISASQQNQSEIISSTPQGSDQKTQRGNGAKK